MISGLREHAIKMCDTIGGGQTQSNQIIRREK